MATRQDYKRDPNGNRFKIGGINTYLPSDMLGPGKYVYLQNVRAYLNDRVTSRATQSTPVLSLGSPITTLRRLNDTTPNGPAAGYILVTGAGTNLFANAVQVDTGFSGKPMSFVPFRPNASVQPWMYVADALKMDKVRSDGLTYKMGVEEPQAPPTVGTQSTTVTGSIVVPGTTMPWLTAAGQNPSYNYGTGGGTNPVFINCAPGTSVSIAASGTVNTSYGSGLGPGGVGPITSNTPGFFVAGGACAVLCGAFTDSSGNVITPAVGSGPISIGTGATFLVPTGATRLQIGIDDHAYGANTGQFALSYSVTTSAVTTVPSLIGQVQAYYWGDSPHDGPVAQYIWKNVSDSGGSGPARGISDASGNTTGNSLIFDSTPSDGTQPVAWSVYDSTPAITGTKSLFQPALESQGYQDFNVTINGTLFIPAAGTYNVSIKYKDNVLWGIGNNANWTGRGTIVGTAGQTETVIGRLPLLPAPTIGGGGGITGNQTVAVTFPGTGSYPIEIDWDYWHNAGRTLVVTINGQNIAPISDTVKQNVQYVYVYRSSKTGALSNPSQPSAQQQIPVFANTVTPLFSTDPQVDKVDYYRLDSNLDNYTYVGTGPNTNPPTVFTDSTLDADISANPILQFDNFEPFPVIDTPHNGTVTVVAGIVTWVSGDKFNVRWLPGATLVNIGGIAYTLSARPTSTTRMEVDAAPDGTNLIYEIAEPELAAQPMPSMWGPTDNAAYMFACGDPINPGTLYWTKGNNPDSAPDTNQQNITSPSEPLMNGVIINGLGMVFSTERAFWIYPNFTNAAATVAGVTGNAFSIQESSANRGLYIRTAIGTDGGSKVFFRGKDGIYVSSGGGEAQSITDADIFNLFPHEGFNPLPITVAGFTVYPPDDTRPDAQQIHFANGYLYYDYKDITGTIRTLIYDVAAGGWGVDVYQWPTTLHELEEGPNVNGTLTGSADGTVRNMIDGGPETGTCVILTASMNGGDARATKNLGDIFLKASIETAAVQVTPYQDRYAAALTGVRTPTLNPVTNSLTSYVIDFINGLPRTLTDVSAVFTWGLGNATVLEQWQPDWTDQPETTQNRPTDWDDAGSAGAMFVQGGILEGDTFGQLKSIAVESSDDGSMHVPDQSPITLNGQSKIALTFTPPFVAHSVRVVTTDGAPWNFWGMKWVTQPFPEQAVEWQTEFGNFGMNGWLSIGPVMNIAHISTADITITLQFAPDAVPSQIVLTVPNSGGVQRKDKIVVPTNKFKLISFRASSSLPFRLFADQCEVRIGEWGRTTAYTVVQPFGGSDAVGASV